jgi:ABC-type dipeptide/oligopeptide/nickel transport system permease component
MVLHFILPHLICEGMHSSKWKDEVVNLVMHVQSVKMPEFWSSFSIAFLFVFKFKTVFLLNPDLVKMHSLK